jgi:hypothetical protein
MIMTTYRVNEKKNKTDNVVPVEIENGVGVHRTNVPDIDDLTLI